MMPERNRSDKEDATIRAEAAEWLVRRAETGHDAESEAAFKAWRDADPRHARCYAEMAALWGTVSEWDELGALEPLERPSLRERWVAWRARRAEAAERKWAGGADWGSLAAAAAVLLLLIAGPFALPYLSGGSERADTAQAQTHETQAGEIREIVLADGSRVTLGAGSSISVSLGEERREVGLLSGEAYFSVATDREAPFFVRARGANVRVVGTEFSVSMGHATTRIAVEEGIVDVAAAGLPAEGVAARGQVRLEAGDGAVAWQNDSSRPLQTVRVDSVAGWRSGRLSYEDAYLADILSDISRYVPTRFKMASPSLGDMRVTASFKADQAAAAVPAILRGLDLTARETEDGVMRIERVSE